MYTYRNKILRNRSAQELRAVLDDHMGNELFGQQRQALNIVRQSGRGKIAVALRDRHPAVRIPAQLPLLALDERYAGWDSELGRRLLDGKTTMDDVSEHVLARNIDPQPRSGRQEMLENLLNEYL